MGNLSQRVGFDIERTLVAPFGGTFTAIGGPLTENPVIILFDNQSDASVQISVDGVNTWKTFPAGEAFVFDCRANHGTACNYTIDLGTQFFGNATGGTGLFSIAITYAR